MLLFTRTLPSPSTALWPVVSRAPESPFTGAFSMFPRISALEPSQKRITFIAVWNDDAFHPFLRHHLYTVQLNADSVDLLLINHKSAPDKQCIDFEKHDMNITWSGNIKHYCTDDEEWRRRVADFLCSPDGWSCNPTEYGSVHAEIQQRQDILNYWRPLFGYIFRDLFPKSDSNFWAWVDLDTFVGNFAHYPFNILSKVSLLAGSQSIPELVYMAGQFTAFNLDDEDLSTAWKRFPAMKSAQHFTQYIDGRFPQSNEEHYWSYGYLRSDQDLPGAKLSYGIYPDIHGDDYYDRVWGLQNSSESYVLSGRDLLLVSSTYTREELEEVVRLERNEPVDDLGGIGWTGGEDGSAYLLNEPTLSASQAKKLAVSKAGCDDGSLCVHNGDVEVVQLTFGRGNCTLNHQWAPDQCVTPPHPDTVSYPPIMRSSFVHFKNQEPNYLLRRLEVDHRRRGYERKLIKHHHGTKRRVEGFPPFLITEDLILKYNQDGVEVFKIGPTRNETLYMRRLGEKDIG